MGWYGQENAHRQIRREVRKGFAGHIRDILMFHVCVYNSGGIGCQKNFLLFSGDCWIFYG